MKKKLFALMAAILVINLNLLPAKAGSIFPTLSSYYAQKISWSSCKGNFQCGTFQVPIDYKNLDAGSFTLNAIKTSQEGKLGSLLLNPGGPGVSATDFAIAATYFFDSSILNNYQIAAFNERGVDDSSLRCLNNSQEDSYLSSWSGLNTEADLQLIEKEALNFVNACSNTFGSNIAHYSTWESAEDMDIFRSLLGNQKLNYYGASYGTLLGAYYLEQFPNRAGRMILDGAIDPNISTVNQALTQAKGFDLELQQFTTKYPSWSIKVIAQLLQQAISKPEVNIDGRKLTYPLFVTAIANSLYTPKSGWQVLNSALKLYAQNKNPSELFALSDEYFQRASNGSYSNLTDLGNVISCDDTNDRPTFSQMPVLVKQFQATAPIFGPLEVNQIALCSLWPKPSPAPNPPFEMTQNQNPILIYSNTRDPATPLIWGEGLHKLINNSQLAILQGDGHTALDQNSDCVNQTTDRYLLTGKLPAASAICNLQSTSA